MTNLDIKNVIKRVYYPKITDFKFISVNDQIIFNFITRFFDKYIFEAKDEDVVMYNEQNRLSDKILCINQRNGIVLKLLKQNFRHHEFYIPSLEELFIYKKPIQQLTPTQKQVGYHRRLRYLDATREFELYYDPDESKRLSPGYALESFFMPDDNLHAPIFKPILRYAIIVDKLPGRYGYKASNVVNLEAILKMLSQFNSLFIEDNGFMPYLSHEVANSSHYNTW